MKYIISILLAVFLIFPVFSESIVNVYPIEEKQSAGIYIKKGEKLNFKVSGKWTLWDQYKQVGPEGHPFTANEYGNWGSLLGQIGDGDIFLISNGLEITSVDEGVFYLFPNKGKYKISNQTGNLEVGIIGGIDLKEFTKILSKKSTKIIYDPKKGPLSTNLFVKKGEKIKIYAFGKWTMWDGIYSDVNAIGHDLFVNGVNWGKLYGGIGSTNGQFLEYFPIGEKISYTASNSGILNIYPYTGDYITSEKGTLSIYIIGGKIATKDNKEFANELVRQTLEKEVIAKLNDIRASVSVPKFVVEKKLSSTAYSHAKYMAMNNVFSRNEKSGNPYFTGKYLKERLKAQGFSEKSREMFVQTDSASDAIDILFSTVYHRLRLLNPAIKYFGYGSYKSNNKTIHVFDLGYDKEKNIIDWDIIVYPPNESTENTLSWSGMENPDPFPIGTIKPLGPPITLMLNKKINRVVKTEIMDEAGKKLNAFIISPETDLNNKQFNAVILVPKMPLEPNTRYIINIKANIGNKKEEKDYTWSFVTKNK